MLWFATFSTSLFSKDFGTRGQRSSSLKTTLSFLTSEVSGSRGHITGVVKDDLMAGRVGPGLRRTGWGQGTGNQSSWPHPMLSRLPSSKGATSVPGVTEPQDSLSRQESPAQSLETGTEGLGCLLPWSSDHGYQAWPLSPAGSSGRLVYPRPQHVSSPPPPLAPSLLSRTKLPGPLGKWRRNKPSDYPQLCSVHSPRPPPASALKRAKREF